MCKVKAKSELVSSARESDPERANVQNLKLRTGVAHLKGTDKLGRER